MRILYFDCFSGISGDMAVGAMLDAGLPIDYLRSELTKIRLDGYELDAQRIERSMIGATRFHVHTHEHLEVQEQAHSHSHEHAHTHDHSHEHDGHHSHDHHHEETDEIHVHSHGLSFAEIKSLIEESSLSGGVKARAIRIFTEIGTAEARIHGMTLETVHFHEVGAVDSIVDIVSVAIGLDYFKIESCYSRSVPLGAGGWVRTAHGIMPIPTPATLEILKDYPTELGAVHSEMTTPTGAGILKACANGLLPQSRTMHPTMIGYGAGKKEFVEVPNLLRVVIGELDSAPSSAAFPEQDMIVQLTTTIDDMTPVQLAYVEEELLRVGALDSYLRPIVMKKGRSAHELVVIIRPENEGEVLTLLARETTTIGIRSEKIGRHLAQRESISRVHPDFGTIQLKHIINGETERLEPEFEEVRRIARERNLPYQEVISRILQFLC